MPEFERITEPTLADYNSSLEIAWCPGCGNFGILQSVKKALISLKLQPHQVLIVSGIGQAGKFPHYLKCNTLNELHGRTLPAAAAAKICNPGLNVIAEGGDGDGYGEGGNHFLSALHRNVPFTYLVHNNGVYGLTKGQASPTSMRGFVTKTTPRGSGEPLNPMAMAIAANASFVARGFSGDIEHLSGLIARAIQNPGFALVDILQPCVTFNQVNTYQFYQSRVYHLNDEKSYDPTNRTAAFEKSLEWGEKIPIGVLYTCDRPPFAANLSLPKEQALVNQNIDPLAVQSLMEEFI